MRWTPNSTVATVIEKEGRFLLVEETDKFTGQLVFNQPAGHLEADDTSLIAAAKRECFEETGWEIDITHYQGLYTYFAPANGVTYHRHCFVGEAVKHHPDSPLDDGILAARWLTLDELVSSGQARSPLVIQCIRDALDKKRYPLEVIYEHPKDDR